jgi:UDP-GlcNAc:undecaprenyl-phosphate/decaprenyl-phosphate GlcNAc-1-phosphate transferase
MSPNAWVLLEALGGLAVTFLLTVLVLPPVIRLSPRDRLFDRVEEPRVGMPGAEPRRVPRLGGVGLFIACAIALTLMASVVGLRSGGRDALGTLGPALAAAAAMVFVVGLVDDLRGVPAPVKLIAQSLAALVMVAAGVRVDVIGVPWVGPVSLGMWAVPVSVLWMVGVSNALNLIDGLDGLASSVTLASLAGVFGAALVLRHTTVALVAASLAGGVAAFLMFNRAPARIFLGDSGSLVLGFMLAVLTVEASRDANGAVLALVPVLSLLYPLLDTAVAVLRRWLRGEPLARADGRHIHHQLCAVGFSPSEAVGFIAVAATSGAALGLAAAFERPLLTAAVALTSGLLLVVLFVYGVRWLEYDEFLEAGASVARLARDGRRSLASKIRARALARAVVECPDLVAIEALLAAAAPELGVVTLGLAREGARRDLPAGVDSLSAPLFRVDWPVADTGSDVGTITANPVVLRVWSWQDQPGAALQAARVAAIVAPALRAWFDVHGSVGARERYPLARRLTPPPGSVSAQ